MKRSLQAGVKRAFNHFRVALWNVLEVLGGPLLGLAATPFLIANLGSSDFGVYAFFLALTGFGALGAFGVSSATIRNVSRLHNVADPQPTVLVVRGGLGTALIGTGIVALVMLVFSVSASTSIFAKIGPQPVVTLAICMGAISLVVTQLDQIFAATLKGTLHFSRNAKFELLYRMALSIGVSAIAYLTNSVSVTITSNLVLVTVAMLLRHYVVCKLLNSGPIIPKVSIEQLKLNWDFGRWQWLQFLGGLAFNTVDKIIVGSVLGAAVLGAYSVSVQLTQQIHSICSAAFSAIFPMLSRRASQGKNDSQSVAILVVIANICVSVALLLIFLIVCKPIISAWFGVLFYIDNERLLKGLACGFALLSLNVGPHYFLMGLGRPAAVSVTSIVGGCAMLVVLVEFLAPWGIIAAPVARMLYGSITLLNYAFLYKALRHEPANA